MNEDAERPVLAAYIKRMGTPYSRIGRAMLSVLEDAALTAWTDSAAQVYLDRRHDFAVDQYFIANKRPVKDTPFGALKKFRGVRAARLELAAASNVAKMFHFRHRTARQAANQAAREQRDCSIR